MASTRLAAFFAALTVLAACASTAPKEETAYIFSSFRGDGETRLHLAYSQDGLTWTALRNDASFLAPEVGGNLMRDPCIIKSPDGMYYMV